MKIKKEREKSYINKNNQNLCINYRHFYIMSLAALPTDRQKNIHRKYAHIVEKCEQKKIDIYNN